ncbi:MAG TPA: hypothetical protein VGJ55_15010, partial [Pyrinomonadaceae bacterium]
QQAFQLFEKGKMTQALPVLQKLAAARPDDGAVLQHLGFAQLALAATLKDEDARRQARITARNTLLRAVGLNYNVEVLQPILNQIPADGGSADFSLNELADKAMKEGEAAFARGDQSKARTSYLRALQLEPTLYEAAVFIADTYFQEKQWGQADEWYARAVTIDPNRDTAYRYWSDSLLRQGKMDESRARAIDAIIAEPYKEISWNGLIQWARGNRVGLSHPRIESPIKAVAWTNERFVKEFPKETVYRHSLREEAEALRTVAEAAARDLKSGKVKLLDESMGYLVKLNEDGLLEAYVLLARADEGISRDYSAYREANREKLRRYLAEYVVQSK